MLRSLLGEPPRKNEGLFADTLEAMTRTAGLFQQIMDKHHEQKQDFFKLQVWTYGLISSIDELEQCTYAAAFFRKRVHTRFMNDMGPDEKGDYARYVYFYKDAFIRVFSLLDKLGTLLNELYELNTAKVKPHYSYFTVLRQLHDLKVHSDLGNKLLSIHEHRKDYISRLRRRRNMEIHYMNAELQDDLWHKHQAMQGRLELENLDEYLADLTQSYQVVLESLHAAFEYTKFYISNQSNRNNVQK